MAATLNQWLEKLEDGVKGGVIDMGLERATEVAKRMGLVPKCPLIIVGGTNGKGSVTSFLSAIYKEAGFRPGALKSPHLIRFNERITVEDEEVSDKEIVEAFERIEAARGEVKLTYFEFNTLAAVDIFMRKNCGVMILEVGLGGRLDAVNVFDADVAIVNTVGLDHMNYLGDTIEKIAFEKAGTFRKDAWAITGDDPAPQSLVDYAQKIGAKLLRKNVDFNHKSDGMVQWNWLFHHVDKDGTKRERARYALPIPALRGSFQLDNATVALAAIECLNDKLPVDIGSIKRGLLLAENPGRFQVLPGRPVVVLDVGHNPQAAKELKRNMISLPFATRSTAVFSILGDKDARTVLQTLKGEFDRWFIAPLDPPRGMTGDEIDALFESEGITERKLFPSVEEAWKQARAEAAEEERIVVFGSFHTVAKAVLAGAK